MTSYNRVQYNINLYVQNIYVCVLCTINGKYIVYCVLYLMIHKCTGIGKLGLLSNGRRSTYTKLNVNEFLSIGLEQLLIIFKIYVEGTIFFNFTMLNLNNVLK